jgi:manganese oxidase
LTVQKQVFQRRDLIRLGLLGVGGVSIGIALPQITRYFQSQSVDIPATTDAPPVSGMNPMAILRDFDRGTAKQENGRTVREFRIEATTSTLQLNSAVSFVSWNFNGRVPGPTLRVNAGERVRVIFLNRGGHAHSMHFHGVHASAMDGVRPVRNGTAAIYEFDAEPFGMHLYHCHVSPVSRHVGKGLYGVFIIDPPGGRPPADEMVMVMGGFDINEDGKNDLYAFNGVPNYYMEHPIRIRQNQLVRLYLLNMVELDPVLTFHLHANLFKLFRTGRSLQPDDESDVVTMGTAERHILEFAYTFPGRYMFHPHQDVIAEKGCMGQFDVVDGMGETVDAGSHTH